MIDGINQLPDPLYLPKGHYFGAPHFLTVDITIDKLWLMGFINQLITRGPHPVNSYDNFIDSSHAQKSQQAAG